MIQDSERRRFLQDLLDAADLPAAWKAFLLSPLPAVIYGAGRQATVVHAFCLMFGKPVFCLMATDSRRRWGYLPFEEELPLYLAAEFPSKKDKGGFDVVIAVNPVHNAAVADTLRNQGWPRLTAVEDWETTNAVTRDAYFAAYLRTKGGRFITDADGAKYVECPFAGGAFRVYYDIDPVYKTNLLGEFGNIVLPSIFGDFSLAGVIGPYEHGDVVLRPGDVVFTLGANIGLFTCVAAAKGCRVHAFEPTPAVVENYLSRNASLYDAITVVPKAVMDRAGKIDFFINDNFAESMNITQHSIFGEIEPSYSRIEVEATTIDAYVAENNINRVDFMKVNTQHAEWQSLTGA
ncbi:MAG: FkbM family methyltransferase, partial [Planctomycetota bacterium]|nr:FkbM family methyltransferase [Planctomycetota bacterium]